MKLTSAVALLAAAIVASTASASAQDHLVKATIPFNFTVGAQTMPAGYYTLSSPLTNPGIVHLSDRSKHNALTVGMPDASSKANDGKLLFHRYGSQYFLSEIRCTDASMNVRFSETKAEKRAKSQVERAGLSIDPPVLLALNEK